MKMECLEELVLGLAGGVKENVGRKAVPILSCPVYNGAFSL